MLDPAPVDPWVAYSPAPGREELPLLREYDLVVAVLEEHELPYTLEEERRYARRLIHLPVPDYHWPPPAALLRAALEVLEAAERGRRVLIHCRGGRGRSATVAAAYLMLRYRVSAAHARRLLRSLRPGSVEAAGQYGVLKALEAGLAAMGDPGRLLERLEHMPLGGEEAKPLLIAAQALSYAELVNPGEASRLAAAALGEGSHPLAEDPGQPGPEDAGYLGDVELLHEDGPSYVLRASLYGHGETLEPWLEDLAEKAGRLYNARIEADIEYE